MTCVFQASRLFRVCEEIAKDLNYLRMYAMKRIHIKYLVLIFCTYLTENTLATSINYQLASLGNNEWEYSYSLHNNLAEDISEFTIYFDRNFYSHIVATATPPGWDSITIQPDNNIPANGFFDSLALLNGISPGQQLSGFSVRFNYLANSTPGTQFFEILNSNFDVIDSGTTKLFRNPDTASVPEPNMFFTFFLGVIFLLLIRLIKLKKNKIKLMHLIFILPASAAFADPVVEDIELVSESRVSRTVFDYTYKVKIKGDATKKFTNITVKAASSANGTSILDNSASLASLDANTVKLSDDTIVIRQDRSYPFRKDLIKWVVTGTAENPQAVEGILVPGDSDSALKNVMPDYGSAVLVNEQDISVDPDSGAKINRTSLYVTFEESSTVKEVNEVLKSINGKIIFGFKGTGVTAIKFSDPGNLVALYALVEKLKKLKYVKYVTVDTIPVVSSLPQEDIFLGKNINNANYLDHLYAIGAPAAWNAKKVLSNSSIESPVLGVYDGFAGVVPEASIQINWDQRSSSFGVPDRIFDPFNHAYHVSGIIAGDLGGTGSLGEVTGVYPSNSFYPKPLTGVAIDIRYQASAYLMLYSIKRNYGTKNIILNTSLQSDWIVCNKTITDVEAMERAQNWANQWTFAISVMQLKLFHAAAAGNIEPCTVTDANGNKIDTGPKITSRLQSRYNSMWGAANLPNALFVENRAASAEQLGVLAAEPQGLDRSFVGDISAIGARSLGGGVAGVHSFYNSGTAGPATGTSMATPQVAGLAAYMWSVRPKLSGEDLATKIKSHAKPTASGGSPVIDAYASLLSLDKVGTDGDAPIRKAILDANDDGSFDSKDTKLFLDALFDPRSGLKLDHSRFDLNGDGITGGSVAVPFDLDKSNEINGNQYEPKIFQKIGNSKEVIEFDENAVTDFDILCYYVYSNLFGAKTNDKSTASDDDRGKNVAAFDGQLHKVRLATKNSSISCKSVKEAKIKINTVAWGIAPGEAIITNFSAKNMFSFSAVGNNSSSCGIGGERGGPIFSASVDTDAAFFAAASSSGVPYDRSVPNRPNCSSFLAYKALGFSSAEKIWINATARSVAGFFSFPFDDEYQVRYYSGDPVIKNTDKSCVIGASYNENNFSEIYPKADCTAEIIYMPKQ